ncbi:hypothetical protein GGR03_001791 [Aurantimonas endophytica]|uniref:Yip1-like protein n=1 Tax=Aurantimonas endophytica TaxID=1522175 RepID=A0A7W6HCW3_9HYPH|nr:hypothetical protein [Aurantimonas endophytica]MBB4002716.1 hypothetical protein [Aurantimonas endophytica]
MKPSSPAGLPPAPDLVPSFDDVLRYFSGALLLMSGKSEGLRRLDLSADGFWQSFSAIVVALPPIALSWIEYEAVERDGPVAETGAVTIYAAHALADVTGWLLPIIVLMLAAKHVGYSKKIVPVVVATNWGGALLAWAFAPYWMLLLLLGTSEATALLGVLVSLASIGLTVRLIYVATGKDIGGASAVTALMVVCSLVSYGAVMDLTGVPLV